MIDFVKISLPSSYRERILNNFELNHTYPINLATGETLKVNSKGIPITPYQTAYHKNLKIKVYDELTTGKGGRVIISGSIHKYWNNGEHNFNDFPIEAVSKVLKDLIEFFSINPNDANLNQLEVGINANMHYLNTDILRNLFYHKKIPFQWKTTPTEGNYYQCEHPNYYIIKIYDKSLQYGRHYDLKEEILRIEFKFFSTKLREFGLYTLEDLLTVNINNLQSFIVRELANVLFYDFTIKSDSDRILKYSNPNYWRNLIEGKRISAYQKHKGNLNQLVENHSEKVLDYIVRKVDQKFKELSSRGVVISTILLEQKDTQKEKLCLVTGLGISMQRKGSKLLSHTGIKFYKSNNYFLYLFIKRKYLSSKWVDKSDSIQMREIAHNIRNRFYNSKEVVNPNQLILF